MTDAEIHGALFRHALAEQGWAGPGADLTGIPLERMLAVEKTAAAKGQFHVADRAVAAIFVAFNYEAEQWPVRTPVVIANGTAVCVVKVNLDAASAKI